MDGGWAERRLAWIEACLRLGGRFGIKEKKSYRNRQFWQKLCKQFWTSALYVSAISPGVAIVVIA